MNCYFKFRMVKKFFKSYAEWTMVYSDGREESSKVSCKDLKVLIETYKLCGCSVEEEADGYTYIRK